MSRRALIQGIGALAAFALAAVALASAGDRSDAPAAARPGVELLAGRGPIRIDDSRAGKAIVSARNMVPGASRAGTVRMRVRGGSARVRLGVRHLRSPPGPRGGRLADSLIVRLHQIGRRGSLFRGRPKDLRRVSLGRWPSGKSRRYRLQVRFPARRTSQNRMQGARASFAVIWRAAARR